jgi:hypothetical protein
MTRHLCFAFDVMVIISLWMSSVAGDIEGQIVQGILHKRDRTAKTKH